MVKSDKCWCHICWFYWKIIHFKMDFNCLHKDLFKHVVKRVNDCLSLWVSPVIDWRRVQGIPSLSPNVCWDRPSSLWPWTVCEWVLMDGWMDKMWMCGTKVALLGRVLNGCKRVLPSLPLYPLLMTKSNQWQIYLECFDSCHCMGRRLEEV